MTNLPQILRVPDVDDDCTDCNGTGEIDGDECENCNGSGINPEIEDN